MAAVRVLIAGESWISTTTHYKGWDLFTSTVFGTGVQAFKAALEKGGHDVTFLPGHLCDKEFPNTMEALSQYDVIILSDIGANSLLLHPDTWLHGKRTPNRLKLLKEWTEAGGGLAMCGGYLTFQGINGSGRYHRTPVEDVLPVTLLPYDDRVEMPEGVHPMPVDTNHPITVSIKGAWPPVLGLNEVKVKPDAKLLVKCGDYPLLAVREVGKGRTLAWTSDIGPHWCPEEFLTWEGYELLWNASVNWLAHRI